MKLYAKCINENCSTIKKGKTYEYFIENGMYKWRLPHGVVDFWGNDRSKELFFKAFKPINQIIQIY